MLNVIVITVVVGIALAIIYAVIRRSRRAELDALSRKDVESDITQSMTLLNIPREEAQRLVDAAHSSTKRT